MVFLEVATGGWYHNGAVLYTYAVVTGSGGQKKSSFEKLLKGCGAEGVRSQVSSERGKNVVEGNERGLGFSGSFVCRRLHDAEASPSEGVSEKCKQGWALKVQMGDGSTFKWQRRGELESFRPSEGVGVKGSGHQGFRVLKQESDGRSFRGRVKRQECGGDRGVDVGSRFQTNVLEDCREGVVVHGRSGRMVAKRLSCIGRVPTGEKAKV